MEFFLLGMRGVGGAREVVQVQVTSLFKFPIIPDMIAYINTNQK